MEIFLVVGAGAEEGLDAALDHDGWKGSVGRMVISGMLLQHVGTTTTAKYRGSDPYGNADLAVEDEKQVRTKMPWRSGSWSLCIAQIRSPRS